MRDRHRRSISFHQDRTWLKRLHNSQRGSKKRLEGHLLSDGIREFVVAASRLPASEPIVLDVSEDGTISIDADSVATAEQVLDIKLL